MCLLLNKACDGTNNLIPATRFYFKYYLVCDGSNHLMHYFKCDLVALFWRIWPVNPLKNAKKVRVFNIFGGNCIWRAILRGKCLLRTTMREKQLLLIEGFQTWRRCTRQMDSKCKMDINISFHLPAFVHSSIVQFSFKHLSIPMFNSPSPLQKIIMIKGDYK